MSKNPRPGFAFEAYRRLVASWMPQDPAVSTRQDAQDGVSEAEGYPCRTEGGKAAGGAFGEGVSHG